MSYFDFPLYVMEREDLFIGEALAIVEVALIKSSFGHWRASSKLHWFSSLEARDEFVCLNRNGMWIKLSKLC